MPGFLSPHTIDIQQGNVVTQDAVDKLRPGMTRAQVRFVLGTPLLTDMFHAQRWDYVFQIRREGQLREEKRFTVYFDGDRLTRWEGDTFPPRRTDLAAPDAAATPDTPAPAAATGATNP
ncbi:outer membrane protein assembly factor BamE [Laribacter hongkongensis]|uniref:outer membrane protein assembly factor BamE n=1 Tax=Laribacter hongkongensis TaxID=168471 RepID=UPI001EFD3785|nr:outer membrane protein assembly factor BamE [Laribacter hongkongensis]MCG9123472.1 outer membrane protein assembly factor BamE [Laribacter hongkongensis]